MPEQRPLTRYVARQASQAANRARLVAAAKRLFAAHGYEGVSLTAIAKAAGLTTGAIAASFSGKEALYRAAVGRPPVTAANCHALQLVLERAQALIGRVAAESGDPEAVSILGELAAVLSPPEPVTQQADVSLERNATALAGQGQQ